LSPSDRSVLINGIDPALVPTLSAGSKIEFNDGFLKAIAKFSRLPIISSQLRIVFTSSHRFSLMGQFIKPILLSIM
jgi:hypothetical protein